MSQKYNSEYINELEAFFIGRNDIVNRYGNAISHYLTLPGLIGFWPMATVQRSTGNVPNYAPTYSGATKQDMVYNGNPTFNYTAAGIPYIDLDGAGDYLSVADNTDIDILGTESWAAVPGLTILSWVNSTAATNEVILAKDGAAAGARSYSIIINASSHARMLVSTDGTNIVQSPDSNTVNASTWSFVAGRFVPSISVDAFVNTTKSSTVAGVPASIFNSASPLEIGRFSLPTLYFSGNITLVALCASALSDAIIKSVYQQTHSLFGV